MWIHVVIFGILGLVAIGWKGGWLPAEGLTDERGRKLFLLLGAAGNLLGLMLTVQHLNTEVPDAYRMEQKSGAYSKEFLVSVDHGEAIPVKVKVPELDGEDEENEEADRISEKEQSQRLVLEALAMYNQGREDGYYYLPDEYEGQTYEWQYPKDTSGSLLSALFLFAGAATLLLKNREKETARQKRMEELLMDYPELIMKFTLLIGAGMTVRNAFGKMGQDYLNGSHPAGRCAYEEILTVCREMDSGVSEAEAYYRFGERCGQVKYKTFATLLIQNLQKGSRQLQGMLERESREAWDERKRKARISGEAAGTKLLFPMLLMMVCVMAIVMIPAVLSFY